MVPKKPMPPSNRLVKEASGWGLFSPVFLPTVILAIVLLFVLAGCGATPVANPDFKPTPVTFNIQVPYLCGQPPLVRTVIMRDVVWDIFEIGGENYFSLTVDNYKALGLNTSDWIAASFEMKEQRNFYRDCITRSQKNIRDEKVD